MSKKDYQIIGIDLGTTNSVIARKGVESAHVIENAEGEKMTRSMVTSFRGEILVGKLAENRWELVPGDTIVSIKRLMGRSINDKEVKDIAKKGSYHYEIVKPQNGTNEGIAVVMGDKEYSPEEISALILKKLKDDASNKLGKEVTHAVITVPAYFTDKQSYATKQAGIKAGLSVMGLIDEPTAVALAYGLDKDIKDIKDPKPKGLLIFDLGGGTFDVSVLMMASGTYTLMGKEGDMWLGGDDFDNIVFECVKKELLKEYNNVPFNDSKFVTRLKKECTKAKEALSYSNVYSIVLSSAFKDEDGDPVDVDVDITREEFERLSAPLVARAMKVVYKALEATMLDKDEDIDYVILAGNSSRMPMIQRAIEDIFGADKVKKNMPFKESVAMGAVLYASRLMGLLCSKCNTINDMVAKKCEKCGEVLHIDTEAVKAADLGGNIAAHSYGIQTEGDKYNIFIDKGDAIPTPKEDRKPQTFTTKNPKYISLPVYGGENMDAASKNVHQLDAFARMPSGYPIGTVVNIRLWLNRDELFEVEGWIADGTRLNFIFTRGQKSAKAVEDYLKLEAKWDNIRNNVLKEDYSQGQEMEMKIDELGNSMGKENADMDNVIDKVQKMNQEIEEILPEPPDYDDKVLANVLIGMIKQFEWAVPRADKEEALKKANDYKSSLISKEEFDNYFYRFMESQPVLAAVSSAKIKLFELQNIDKHKFNTYSNKFENIIDDLKKGHQSAANELVVLIQEINDIVGSDGMVTCSKCGTQNQSSTIKCTKCGCPLGLLS